MAVSFVSSSSAFTDVASSIVIPAPAGIQVGDVLMFSGVAGSGLGGPLFPAFTHILIDSQDDIPNDVNSIVYYRIADAGDAVAATFTFFRGGAGTGAFGGILSAYRGVDPSNPIEANKEGSGGNPVLDAIDGVVPGYTIWPTTTIIPDDMVVHVVAGGTAAPGAPTHTPPTTPSALPGTSLPVTSAVASRSVLEGHHPMPTPGMSPSWTGGSSSEAFIQGFTVVLQAFTPPPSDIEVDETDVVASDMLSITFNKDAKNNDLLKDPTNYTVTPVGEGQPVTVRSVQAGNEIRTDYITLEVTPFTVGEEYLVTVSNIVAADAGVLSPTDNTAEFAGRLTKTDDAIRYRENIYGRDVNSMVRNILTAISLEDDKIGGNRR